MSFEKHVFTGSGVTASFFLEKSIVLIEKMPADSCCCSGFGVVVGAAVVVDGAAVVDVIEALSAIADDTIGLLVVVVISTEPIAMEISTTAIATLNIRTAVVAIVF